ncbi:MAG: hypothetical protein JNL82_28235 [Myxococcales bacterium]|nr:hypothetical protein [Myxococcales bacterium]
MSISTKHRLFCLASGLVAFSAASDARAIDKYIDLEPPQTKSGYGYGYDSISRTFILRQCVQFTPGQVEGNAGASGDDFKFSSIVSNAQLADEMDLSVTTKFSASMGVASASSSTKVDFFQSTKTNLLTHTILASYNNVEPMKYIAGDLTLKPEYLAMVGTPAFRQQCGDYVIIGEQQGRWFFGTVQLQVKDTTTESKLAAGGTVDAQYGTFAAEVGVNTVNKLKQASQSQDLQIRVTSSGTNSASLTIDQFLAQVQAFPGQAGPKQTYKLKAVPFENIVANWPVTDPLAPLTAEQKFARLGEAAWGLTALVADSDFVTQHAKLFALGTTPQKRDARVAAIKARRGWYQSQLDSMRNQAKNCDVDWNSSPACEALYNKWKDYADFAVSEYDLFPARYVSDCYAARDASDGIQAQLKNALTTSFGQFSNTKGDREVGGGPVAFSSHLTFKPDNTGGNALEVRKLLATLKIKVEEDKADHTTFETTLKVPVFNLATPDLSQGAPMTMGQCAYKGAGVKAEQITEDPAVCEILKQFGQAQYQQCKDAIAANKYHGILRGKTGEDPRTETFNKNGRGVLASMQCSVDSDHGNDTDLIGCKAIGLRSIQLDLVNTQDLAADGYVAPPLPKANDPVYINKDALSRATLVKLLKPVNGGAMVPMKGGATVPTRGGTKPTLPQAKCNGNLVRVQNECVPKLKR